MRGIHEQQCALDGRNHSDISSKINDLVESRVISKFKWEDQSGYNRNTYDRSTSCLPHGIETGFSGFSNKASTRRSSSTGDLEWSCWWSRWGRTGFQGTRLASEPCDGVTASLSSKIFQAGPGNLCERKHSESIISGSTYIQSEHKRSAISLAPLDVCYTPGLVY